MCLPFTLLEQKGGFCGLVSKDGRAWTPGPGRYSQGNPNGSSVRYDKLKYSRMPSTIDDQKTRWPSDSCLPVAQHGGVIINPTRGFSMGTGLGPSETVRLAIAKIFISVPTHPLLSSLVISLTCTFFCLAMSRRRSNMRNLRTAILIAHLPISLS